MSRLFGGSTRRGRARRTGTGSRGGLPGFDGLVQHVTNELGYHDAAGWIEENRSAYIRGVYNGFEVADMGVGEG
jgi:hypothetical protein